MKFRVLFRMSNGWVRQYRMQYQRTHPRKPCTHPRKPHLWRKLEIMKSSCRLPLFFMFFVFWSLSAHETQPCTAWDLHLAFHLAFAFGICIWHLAFGIGIDDSAQGELTSTHRCWCAALTVKKALNFPFSAEGVRNNFYALETRNKAGN